MAKIVITTTSLRLSLASFCLKSKKNHAKRPIMSLRTGTARLMNKNSYIVISVKLGFTVVVFFTGLFCFSSLFEMKTISSTRMMPTTRAYLENQCPFCFLFFCLGGGEGFTLQNLGFCEDFISKLPKIY